jgi:hypothetical protein
MAEELAQELTKQGKRAARKAAKAARKQAIHALGVREANRWGGIGWLLVGVGLGSLVTYLMDPDRGRRRQAIIRDRVMQAGSAVQTEVPKRIHDAQSKIQHLQQTAMHRRQDDDGDAGTPATDPDADPTSPDWEMRHNDGGALTGPSY